MGTLFLRGVYYSRLLVPADLRPLLGRNEIRKSLRASSYRDAKLRASRWEWRLAELFNHLRQRGGHMKPEQIKRLVQHYLTSSLEESEAERVNGRDIDDSEQESMICALTDALEDTQFQLLRKDF